MVCKRYNNAWSSAAKGYLVQKTSSGPATMVGPNPTREEPRTSDRGGWLVVASASPWCRLIVFLSTASRNDLRFVLFRASGWGTCLWWVEARFQTPSTGNKFLASPERKTCELLKNVSDIVQRSSTHLTKERVRWLVTCPRTNYFLFALFNSQYASSTQWTRNIFG